MYNPETGAFEQGNIQDWQHSAMYAAFVISGAVDLIGFYTSSALLPQGIEHVNILTVKLFDFLCLLGGKVP